MAGRRPIGRGALGCLDVYDYASPAFDFSAVLVYDQHGFVLDYPGIAVRTA